MCLYLSHVMVGPLSIDQVEGHPEVSKAASPADPVQVGLYICIHTAVDHWQVSIDHQQHSSHVDATGQHICSY